MRNYKNNPCVVLAVFLLLLVIPAQASILGTYSDRGAWQMLTSGRTDIDFSSLSLGVGSFLNYSNATGLTIDGAVFTGPDGPSAYLLYALNPSAGTDEDFNSGSLLVGPTYRSDAFLRIVLPTGTTSFGIDLGAIFPAVTSFIVYLDGISAGTVTTQSRPNLTFFGVRTDTAIGQVTLALDSGTLFTTRGIFDNVSFGLADGGGGGGGAGASETPEVTTMFYVGSGMALIAWAKRRRKSAFA